MKPLLSIQPLRISEVASNGPDKPQLFNIWKHFQFIFQNGLIQFASVGISLFLLAACSKPELKVSAELDGRDCAHAIVVRSVSDEYRWLKCKYPGYFTVQQSLNNCEGLPVDIHKVLLPDGSVHEIYFILKIQLETETKMFKIK